MAKVTVKTNKEKVKRDLEKWKIKQTDSFSKKFTKVCKMASVRLQEKINKKVDRPVNFTKNAVGFRFEKHKRYTENIIFIKKIQARYLGAYIEGDTVSKFQPVDESRKNAYGNIKQLKSKKYRKIVHKNGRQILIDPTKKNGKLRKNGKGRTVGRRLIATMETHKRKITLGTWKENKKELVRMINNHMKLI